MIKLGNLVLAFYLLGNAVACAPIHADEAIVTSEGKRGSLVASIDSVAVLILESFPVQVHLAIVGNKSVPCVELEPIVVSRKGNVFHVRVTETVLGPAESCIAMLAPFKTNVILDVYGLKAGDYQVLVNAVESAFTFDIDNR